MTAKTKGVSLFVSIQIAIGLYCAINGLDIGASFAAGAVFGELILLLLIAIAEREDRRIREGRPRFPRLLGLSLLWAWVAEAIIPVVIGLAVVFGLGTWAALKIWSKASDIKINQNGRPIDPDVGGVGGGGHEAIDCPSTQPPLPVVSAEVGLVDGWPGIQIAIPAHSLLQWSTNLIEWRDMAASGDEATFALERCNLPQCFFRLRPIGGAE